MLRRIYSVVCDYGISDLMRDQANKKANTGVMKVGTSFISDVLGYIIALGVYALLLGQFVMTACDLLFIAVPFTRKLLVSQKAVDQGKLGSTSNPHLLGHYSGWDDLRDRRLAEAEMYARQGNMVMAENKLRWAQSAQNESIKSDARRSAINEQTLSRQKNNVPASTSRVGFDWSSRCFVSNDLKQMFTTGQHVNLMSYLKKRAFTIILMVLLIMLVVASNTFINTGMNVGKAVLKMLGV